MLVSNGSLPLWGPGSLLDCRRLLLCCKVLLALEILTALFLIAGTYGLIVPLTKPLTTDFVSFYAAGTLTDAAHHSWYMTRLSTTRQRSRQQQPA
jgi:hypothetical protein